MKTTIIASLLIIFASVCALAQGGVSGSFANCANGQQVYYTTSGNLICDTGTPSLGSCGSSPALVAGSTNLQGQITAGSGVLTACVLNFSKTLSAIPRCLVTTSLGAAWITSLSTTSITITAVSLTSGTIYYNCWGAS